MARYSLRNQQKIKEVYGTSVLERMKVSLDAYFKADDIITDTFERMSSSDQKEIAERIADALTSEQREALAEYIKEG